MLEGRDLTSRPSDLYPRLSSTKANTVAVAKRGAGFGLGPPLMHSPRTALGRFEPSTVDLEVVPLTSLTRWRRVGSQEALRYHHHQ